MVVREQLLDPMRVHNLGTEAEQEKRVKELLELTGLPAPPPRFFPASFRAASASASQLPVPCR